MAEVTKKSMAVTQKKYPAKLLLFGEYTVIQGSKALAVPLSLFGGQWRTASFSEKAIIKERQDGLWKLLHHCEKYFADQLDITSFATALQRDEYFASDIPQGYGAGSSGAVCAAIYDRFAIHKIIPDTSKKLLLLKQLLAGIENAFHGASSGLDPLVCYLNKGVIIEDNEQISIIEHAADNMSGFFLIDTGISRSTAPLVKLFKQQCEEDIYAQRLEAELIPLVEDAIDFFLDHKKDPLLTTLHHISHFQFKHFAGMIPTGFRTAWLDGLASSHTKLKLCGAGGGGFLLGYSANIASTKALFSTYRKQLLFLGT